METYKQLRERQQKEYNEFSNNNMFYAYNDRQFAEGLEKIGATAEEVVQTYAGAFTRKDNTAALFNLCRRFDDEMHAAMAADTTGTGFMYDAFVDELFNHEYCITEDPRSTLDALGLTWQEVRNNEVMRAALERAEEYVLENSSW